MAVDKEKRRQYVERYRAKPGVREAEREYGKKYDRAVRATVRGRAISLLRGARGRAKQRNLPFDLDLSFIVQQLERGTCPVLGLSFDLSPERSTWHNPLAPSIDRVDSRLGYTKNNVQVVSVWWNIAKSQWSEDFNKMAVRRAVDYFALKERLPWQ